jgi:hypothetical protein
MTRATRGRHAAPPLALALAMALLGGLGACTPRPDEPAAPGAGTAPAAGPATQAPATGAPPDPSPAAGGSEAGGGGETEEPVLVRVDRMTVAMLKSFPVQVHANLEGHLSDACVEAGEAEVRRDGNTFTITIPASRPPGRMCAQVLVPFLRTVPLPVRDLPAGKYRIQAHGANASFTLDRDNSFNPAD